MSRHSISRLLAAWALCALALHAGALRAAPDPVAYGVQVEAGNIAQVREWLDARLDPDFLADRIGTGLMIAAWYGNIPMMELLVSHGADVNKTNALGERALMHAAWRGQAEAVKWLLAKGARIDSEPMHWGPLHYAAFAGQGGVATLLIERGADINARSTNGSSALMMAVYEGHEQMVRLLLARGADRSVKNDRGDGALEWAFKFQRLGIARLVASPQEFVAAANLPKAQWGEPRRSLPAATAPLMLEPADPTAGKIAELLNMRDILAARGLSNAADKLDRRIAALRAQRARAERSTPQAAVLEISASRASPRNQETRQLFGTDGQPP